MGSTVQIDTDPSMTIVDRWGSDSTTYVLAGVEERTAGEELGKRYRILPGKLDMGHVV